MLLKRRNILNSFFSTIQVCPTGYLGLHCNESCPFPSYGVSCRLYCFCEKKLCHNVHGCYIEQTEGMKHLLNWSLTKLLMTLCLNFAVYVDCFWKLILRQY